MNHEEALEKTDKSLEKLYEPLYSRKRERKPVPPSILDHYKTTSEKLYSFLRTDRLGEAKRFYHIQKDEIERMFEELE